MDWGSILETELIGPTSEVEVGVKQKGPLNFLGLP